MSNLILFFIPAILILLINPIGDKIKAKKQIETESIDVLRNYIYAFIMISYWISIVFRVDKLFIYFAVFGLFAYFVYRTLTEDILKNIKINF